MAVTTSMLPIYCNQYPWMHATLDGILLEEKTFVELKHTHAGASLREKAVYYLPQLAHYAHIMQTDHCMFSIIKGNAEPEFGRVDIPVEYTEQLLNMERAFYWHIENNIPPEATPVISQEVAAKTAKVISIGGLKPYDMTESNEWGDAAVTWLTTRAEAKTNADKANVDRLQAIATEAAEQTGRLDVPMIDEPVKLSDDPVTLRALTAVPVDLLQAVWTQGGKVLSTDPELVLDDTQPTCGTITLTLTDPNRHEAKDFLRLPSRWTCFSTPRLPPLTCRPSKANALPSHSRSS
jgi:hypothetical protein